MDLATVARKIRMGQYAEKSDFVNDLYLIYSNCLEYNSNPVLYYF